MALELGSQFVFFNWDNFAWERIKLEHGICVSNHTEEYYGFSFPTKYIGHTMETHL